MVINAVIECDQDGFFTFAPSLPGCVSQGGSYKEALHNIKEAIGLYLESIQ
ncbi:hypothetical protein NHP200010_14130 [Helicobacter bizzozeronii]|nr:type II toxin-antitoxin system HicB family antitoxin [Helicobacter bizzozeronii]GMB93686.1 hypothetical protein NHP200010_14130 [Helicobacter bizzozeronii]